MREEVSNEHISVKAIAGTYVVLLGLDAKPQAAVGLLGFTIYKQKGTGRREVLGGGKLFKGVHDEAERRDIRSDRAPLQSFMWSDYEAEPNQKYTYHIVPVYGQPGKLEPREQHALKVTIRTEDPQGETHGIYFNRGVAGSQAYSREFGDHLRYYLSTDRFGKVKATPFIKPKDVPDRKAYIWLSRGLEEAMGAFIDQATGPGYSIRAAVYELTYMPIIQKFVGALERGVDVKIVHHAKRAPAYLLKSAKGENQPSTSTTWKTDKNIPEDAYAKPLKKYLVHDKEEKDAVCRAADEAVGQVGLKAPDKDLLEAFNKMLIERRDTTISHNKFIVLLKDGKPVQVWTGSTNYTEGGIFGQSNVGHIVRDAKVAKKYLGYWKKLSTDPKKTSNKNDPPDLGLQNWTVRQQPVPNGPPPANSVMPVFSPRLKPQKGDKEMLDWYAERLDSAKHSVFLTSAFSVARQFLNVLKDAKDIGDQPYLRYLLLEGKGGLLADKYPILVDCPQNKVAYGDTLATRKKQGPEQFIETLTGLNDHVNYLHTKYMLIDPLSDDPIVITGSANFSDASTHDNDENMLIIRGDTRVADIFLGEFMRLFNHFETRNRSNALTDKQYQERHFLTDDDSWTQPHYDDGSQHQQQRLLFKAKSSW